MSSLAVETKSADEDEETELQPTKDQIAEDCLALVRLTRSDAPHNRRGDCPQCGEDSETKEVLRFTGFQIENVSASGATCAVAVTIRGSFNASTSGVITGGLIGWIPSQQRAQYEQGETPTGDQLYKVKVMYQRNETGWSAVEFN